MSDTTTTSTEPRPRRNMFVGSVEINTIRRKNLQMLVAHERTIVEFAKKFDIDKTYVQQLLSGVTVSTDGSRKGRNIGEKSARSIEGKCGLEPGWLDVPHWDGTNVAPGPEIAGRIP